MKKGQGLPLQTIIIAILALLVLVVVIAIFTGKIRGWGQQSNTCEGIGGQLVQTSACSIADGHIPLGRTYREFTPSENYQKANPACTCCKVNPKKPLSQYACTNPVIDT